MFIINKNKERSPKYNGYIRKLAPLKSLQKATSSSYTHYPVIFLSLSLSTMALAFAPTAKPLPPVRAAAAAAGIGYGASSSYAPCFSALTSRSRIRLPNRRKAPMLITCGAGAGAGAVRDIDESQFSDVVLNSACPVLVEFIATWCGPCRLIAPAVQSLAQVSWGYYPTRVLRRLVHFT